MGYLNQHSSIENYILMIIIEFSYEDRELLTRIQINSSVHPTLGKHNYFTGYGILLHELPVVAVFF